MKPQAIERCERILAKGRRRCILLNGLLGHGLGLFATSLVMARDAMNPRFVMISALLSAIGGALFGAAIWALTVRQYRKALRSAAR